MKRILVISWFYPPINSSEGLVTFKLINNSKYCYDVFTQKKSLTWTFGATMDYEDGPNVHAIFDDSDTLVDWQTHAVRYFEEHQSQYDIIMTRSMPPESHLIGLQIKEHHPNVKWIASFGDPISTYPYDHINNILYSKHSLKNLRNRNASFRYRFSPLRIARDFLWKYQNRKSARLRKKQISAEEVTLKKADMIIFNNLSQQRLMAKDANILEKSVVLHHSYEKRFFSGISRKKAESNKVRFVFMGQLNFLRTSLPLLRAIKALSEECQDLSDCAEFVFYGEMPDCDLGYILRNHLTDIVKYEDPIVYKESLTQAMQADWLLHIDADISAVCDENVFFAGKIADYFGARNSILSVSMQKGDVVDCLRRAGMLTLSYSINEIKQYLYLIIYKGFSLSPDWEYVESEFEATHVAKHFDKEVIGRLLSSE